MIDFTEDDFNNSKEISYKICDFLNSLNQILPITSDFTEKVLGKESENYFLFHNINSLTYIAISKENSSINYTPIAPINSLRWVNIGASDPNNMIKNKLKYLKYLQMESDLLEGKQLGLILEKHQEKIEYKKSKKGLL